MAPRDTDYVSRLRNRIGTRKVFLVFATVILRDKRGRFLLQRRTDFDFWGLPGGVLEPGETLQECARRELTEETGLEAGPLRLVGLYTDPRYDVVYPNGDQTQQFTVCFAGIVRGGRLRADGRETRDHRYFAADRLPWGEMPIWYRDMLRDALQNAEPAFRPPRSVATHDAGQLPFLEDTPLVTTSASVALADGERVLLTTIRGEQRLHFPGDFMRLGENAAGTARRALMEVAVTSATIERIIGVYAGIAMPPPPTSRTCWNVGVLFAGRLDRREDRASGRWIAVADLHRCRLPLAEPLLCALVAQHLRGGHFVV